MLNKERKTDFQALSNLSITSEFSTVSYCP